MSDLTRLFTKFDEKSKKKQPPSSNNNQDTDLVKKILANHTGQYNNLTHNIERKTVLNIILDETKNTQNNNSNISQDDFNKLI